MLPGVPETSSLADANEVGLRSDDSAVLSYPWRICHVETNMYSSGSLQNLDVKVGRYTPSVAGNSVGVLRFT